MPIGYSTHISIQVVNLFFLLATKISCATMDTKLDALEANWDLVALPPNKRPLAATGFTR